MTGRAPGPLAFLERQSYRQRRLGDAARILPVFGAVIFALPLLWTGPGQSGHTGRAGLWLFAAWLGLIVLSAILTRALTRMEQAGETDRADPDGPNGSL